MTDLEDRFLKKNIPGKYSQWDDFNEKRQNEEEDDDQMDEWEFDKNKSTEFEQVRKWDRDSVPKPLQISALASKNNINNSKHATGPKGVLNDYREQKQLEAYNRQIEEEERKKILSRALNGSYLKHGESSISAASLEAASKSKNIRDKQDNDDDDFLAKYREKRLQQMKYSYSLPRFGNFIELESRFEYVDTIDETDPRISVIIHIYEPTIKECNLLNEHLDTLARGDLKIGTRFCRIRAFTLKDDFDVIGLPALVLYRGSNLIRNWTRIVNYLPLENRKKFTSDDIRNLIEPEVENGLMMVKNIESQSFYKPAQRKSISGVGKNYDSDYDSEDAELDELCADFLPSL